MEIKLPVNAEKKAVFETVKNYLQQHGFLIVNSDQNRPWGGFYVIDEQQSQKFIDFFFSDVKESSKRSGSGKISPKILIVEKEKRLSWQYHLRRAELWKVIGGNVEVVTSDNDKESKKQKKKINEVVVLKQGERHRLIGLNSWGIVAEIWQHTDKDKPSDEEDIVRVQDDFGR
jgi:mannose-6-phosphate isomerase-like protein (cupin superfamily)